MASDRDELIEHYFNSGYNYAEIIFIYNYQIISLYSFVIKNRNLLELVRITSNKKNWENMRLEELANSIFYLGMDELLQGVIDFKIFRALLFKKIKKMPGGI